MDLSDTFLSEDQLQCSICLSVFTDPVSTTCGHNFCLPCLREYWDSRSHCHCPVCKEEFGKRPELRVNTFISGLTAHFKKSLQLKSGRSAEKAATPRVLCDICSGKERAALKSCLICMASYCSAHLEPHHVVSSLKKHKLMEPVEKLEDYICQKHERPLELFCRDDQACVCLFCTETDHRTHSTVPIEQEIAEKKNLLVQSESEIQQMIHYRLKKIEEIKHSVELYKKNMEKDVSDSADVFRSLVRCVERSQAELLEMMKEKQIAVERQAEESITELEEEVKELKRRVAELEQLPHNEDQLQVLQIYLSLSSPPRTKNWSEINIYTHLSVETLRTALSHLEEALQKEMEKFVEIVDVTLDPDTAHPNLMLSEDGKQVRLGDAPQNLPDNPERFDFCVNVLGKEGFSSGRFYYEVQVGGKTKWDLGVASTFIKRKGEITASPENGEWSVWLRNEREYEALDSPPVRLSLKQPPQKVGVFVDYEEGLVSFYDVEARSHIYSFTRQSFTENLYPLFSPCNNDGGKNSAPLVICPVQH